MSDVTRIDRHNYPAIFTACVYILRDSGGVNRLDTPDGAEHLVFLLPAHPASGFGRMEAALLGISSEAQFETFCYGEDSESAAIASTDPDLEQLHTLLNAWFDAGMPHQ